MKTMILGSGGREAALACRMAQDSQLFAFMKHVNPTIARAVRNSGGKHAIGNILDPKEVALFAVKNGIDMAMVSADDPIEKGVVDELQNQGIPTMGATRAAAELEWNKAFTRNLLNKIAPEANPEFMVAYGEQEVKGFFDSLGDTEIAVKPAGLTGGKGVKVMGPHLKDKNEAMDYAIKVLREKIGETPGVILEERMVGAEITIQAITDGRSILSPPATYDYPFRYDGDCGPGTGGMGSFNEKGKVLPFMQMSEYEKCMEIIRKVLRRMEEEGKPFVGVLNAGFFLRGKDVKVMEFNSRFGDPECINIMEIFKGSWVDLMDSVTRRSLDPTQNYFSDLSSVLIYLVSPEYAISRGVSRKFALDMKAIEKEDCRIYFSSAEKVKGKPLYQTIGTSRAVGIASSDPDRCRAREKVVSAINKYVSGPLEWRRDIASEENVKKFTAFLEQLRR